jgi:hypothetical protein
MSLIIDEASKLGDKSSEILPYAPYPTQITKSKHFKSITETNIDMGPTSNIGDNTNKAHNVSDG